MSLSRLVALVPLLLVVVAVSVFAGWSLRHHSAQVIPEALVGRRVPATSLPQLDGGPPVSVSKTIQGPTLVNFFASWCGPCAVEAPALMALKLEGVRIIGIAHKDDPAASRGFLARYGNPYTVVLSDRDGGAGLEFGVTGVPETYAVTAMGVIGAKRATPLTADDAEALVQAARRAP
jgi:cytochrome c biogenesis protein CcmG/thiol:disulfide interchange protein DsbE